jgi:ABC-2 type transport system permease protein
VLWYKTWLETRSRFLTSLCGITIIISFFVHHAESLFPAGPKKSVCNIIFFTHQYLVGIWILSVILLGMGGLVRERALGTSSLTLALPVSRARLAGVRIAVGMLQAISLAVFPWVSILLITDLGQVSFPISQASFYLALLISGGMIYFALAVLISTCIEGEYTAPAISYGLTILTGMVFGEVKWIRPYADLWRFMGGDNHINKNTYLLSGPFPWLGVSASLCVAGLMLFASVWVLQKQEF